MLLYYKPVECPLISNLNKMLLDCANYCRQPDYFEMTAVEMSIYIKEIKKLSKLNYFDGDKNNTFYVNNSFYFNNIVNQNKEIHDFLIKRLIKDWQNGKITIQFMKVDIKPKNK